MHLSERSWTDVSEAAADVALLPVGSTEQHGPHAPLGTDTLLAEAVASRGADRSEYDSVIAPALPIGVAEEHRRFAGTLWLSPETFRSMVMETITSLAHHGWMRVIVVNGHGGNVPALRETCERVTRDGLAECVSFTWFDAIDVPKSELGHGGSIETAGVLATRPELIHADRLETAAAEAGDRWGRWVGGVNVAVDTDEFTENGVIGDPTAASEARGEAFLDDAADSLSQVIDELVRTD